MDSQQTRKEARFRNAEQLMRIRDALYPVSTLHLCQDDLTALGIKWSKMELQENELDSGPRFCTPFPSDAIGAAFEKAFVDENYPDVCQPGWCPYTPEIQDAFYSALQLGEKMLQYLGDQGCDWHLIASTKWERKGRHTRALPFLEGFYNNRADKWRVIEIFQILGSPQPHLACVLIDGAEADDRLRRSEVVCALEFMMRGIVLDRRNEFVVNPVFVYSFSNRNARMLQAHFDGSHLVIRTTPYLNFEEENEENLKLYLRWMMSEPIGSTRFPDEKDCCDTEHDSNAAASLISQSLEVITA